MRRPAGDRPDLRMLAVRVRTVLSPSKVSILLSSTSLVSRPARSASSVLAVAGLAVAGTAGLGAAQVAHAPSASAYTCLLYTSDAAD